MTVARSMSARISASGVSPNASSDVVPRDVREQVPVIVHVAALSANVPVADLDFGAARDDGRRGSLSRARASSPPAARKAATGAKTSRPRNVRPRGRCFRSGATAVSSIARARSIPNLSRDVAHDAVIGTHDDAVARPDKDVSPLSAHTRIHDGEKHGTRRPVLEDSGEDEARFGDGERSDPVSEIDDRPLRGSAARMAPFIAPT